ELLVVAHADDVLDPELVTALDVLDERLVAIRGREHDRVRGTGRSVIRPWAVREQRQVGLAAERRMPHDETLRTAGLRGPRGFTVPDFDDPRDPVACGDPLTQPSWGHDGGC